MKRTDNILSLIGKTPLLKLNKVAAGVPANVFVKLELLNPSGSYKDRMALSMVEAAEKGLTWNGKRLLPGGTVCDASAGNTAPALAFVCAVKGYKAKLGIYKPVLTGGGTRLKITGAYGPEVSECPPPTNYLSQDVFDKLSHEEKDLSWVIAGKTYMYELERDNPEVVWVDQIYNKYNYLGQKSIGHEIYEQLDGKVDAWGCAVGSGGTLLGAGLALKDEGAKPITFGVVPHGSESYITLKKPESRKGEFEASKMRKTLVELMGLNKWLTEKSIVEEMIHMGYPDEFFMQSAEEARDMANRLCREEGIYCGMSSGANVAVALKVARTLKKGQNVVTVIVDRRDRYLGEYPNDVFVV
ncbi:MAG: cysteine synthase family protein [Thaumarchaeota archaeon]|nr:cysteine synthase family protein [Nitrososphaerota archaeon]